MNRISFSQNSYTPPAVSGPAHIHYKDVNDYKKYYSYEPRICQARKSLLKDTSEFVGNTTFNIASVSVVAASATAGGYFVLKILNFLRK